MKAFIFRLRKWLSDLPIQDPVERCLAYLLQVILLGFIGIVLVAAVLNLLIPAGIAWQVILIRSSIFILIMGIPLVLLRRGHFHIPALIIITIIFILESFAVMRASLREIAETLLFFTLIIMLSGLLLGRRVLALTFTFSAGVILLKTFLEKSVAIRLDSFAIAGNFILLNGLMSLFLDQFGLTFRQALTAALERERQLQNEITVRKRTEAALQASEGRFRALIENGLDEIVVFDSQLKPIYMSPSVIRASEYSWEEIVEADPFTSVHPEDQPAARKLYEWLLQHPGQPREYQLRLGRGDDSLRWTEGVAINLLGDPSVKGIVINYRDVTERKRAEQALQEKERLLSEAERVGQIGSWSYDIREDTFQFSDEMYRLFDISSEEFHHTMEGLLGLVYSQDRPAFIAWMDKIKAGARVTELEFRVFRKNGELRYMRAKGALEFDPDGQPICLIGMARDVSERKLAEIQIYQQIQRLNALRKIDLAITSNFNLRLTLNTLISEVSTQLQVDAADILLLDPDGEMLTYAAGQGFRTHLNENARIPIGESYAGRAAKERRLVRIDNLKDQSHGPLLTVLLAEEDFVGYYGVPLITKGKVIGVLEIFHRTPLQPYAEWLDFLNILAGQAAIAIENAALFENLDRSNRELSQAYDATIEGWSRALDLRDKETEGHTLRVTELTMNLARKFAFTEEDLLHIRWGALLHDIGKMGVPDRILLKSEPLTEEEQIIMQRHPQYAYDLLKPIAFLDSTLDIPYCHHERWDGTGYPRGLKGEEIPLAARLFAITDVWDALTCDRPYRPAWSEEEALAYIREQSGKQFDSQVVELFLRVIKGK